MMDHGRFEYSPIIDRPPLKWPNGARVAMWVIPNVEHFHFDRLYGGTATTPPDVIAYAPRDYGNRVGVWRLMDMFDRYKIRATAALNAEICEFEPRIIEEGNKRGWEWMGHNLTNSTLLAGLDEAQERHIISETVRIITSGTGKAPRGWLGSGLAETVRTPDILTEHGIQYVGDWVNDDQPYPMKTAHGPLYAIPYSSEINDLPQYSRRNVTPMEFARMIRDQFDTLYAEGEHSGRVMAICLHPFVSGVPHRVKYLDEALAYIAGHDHVWWATGSEIIEAYKAAVS
ncbi:MAG TPA: polysaccharide deacetylase family protein [Chloroflexota bacterium]|nr:polysaccharide deacetylase family protein [Chloroflexota bacterium]